VSNNVNLVQIIDSSGVEHSRILTKLASQLWSSLVFLAHWATEWTFQVGHGAKWNIC